MKKIIFFFFLFAALNLGAQEDAEAENQMENDIQMDSNWNIDSFFNDPDVEYLEEPETKPINLRDRVLLEASYGFIAAFSPGWSEVPWYNGNDKREYSYLLGARMEALLSIDLPLTEALRVHNAFYFSVPDNSIFSIYEFYFDYNIQNRAFLQAGLYEIAWGISRFYPFTNLPALVPNDNDDPGNAYIGRLRIPIGIGGLELIGMTRSGYMEDRASPTFNEFAFGMKYNMAFQLADIDTGLLYHKELPMRFFVSLKTTIQDTELYTEGLVSVSQEESHKTFFSGNVGIVKDFFNGKLTVSGEIFYNGESEAAWWRPKTEALEESVVNLYKGLNGALAFVIRPGIIGMRIFAQALYTYEERSVWLVPGISIKPGGINITLSVPMALGERRAPYDKSNYYRNNIDEDNRPFSIILGVSLNGKLRYTL